MPAEKRIAIRGSERVPLAGARRVGPADPAEAVQVTVVLRRRQSSKGPEAAIEEMSRLLPGERTLLSREEYAAAHGADPADLAKIEQFAHENGLTVAESSPARRSIVLTGTVAQMNAAFGVDLGNYEHSTGRYRGRTGSVTVPENLGPIVQSVLGLDNRPVAKPHIRRRKAQAGARAAGGGFLPTDVARIYNFPTAVQGNGQTIGIIELGGGYRTGELHRYFSQLSISPAPKVTAVSVDGGHNRPGQDQNADGEVMLDIEVAGSVAPGARIAVYFAPNTDQGFHDAITTAVHDGMRKPSVISISWGGPETGPPNEAWTQQAIDAMNSALQDAASVGVTVTVAAGDNGSTDGVSDNQPHVDFPASSPYALGCGGTNLTVNGNNVSEVVWNELPNNEGATGGGVSAAFAMPSYQTQAGIKGNGRGVPDVAGDADPQTGYQILVDGQQTVIGGTSAVAPLYAGLIALINQQLGQPVGFVNPLLYSRMSPGSFRDIVVGSNGGFTAAPGYDNCTGLGSPNGSGILASLQGAGQAEAARK